MNYDRSLIFAYLEEDNVQRAYFRVCPLLTSEGDIRQEAESLWPNEGGLRIVPDRNEQHTFKTRMRTLGAFCIVDLRGLPAEAGKIRTNKNYRPDRGEVNQYILYSDTVHPLPEHTFYQLIDGNAADYQSIAEQAITPLFYIRENDTLYGPVKKHTPEKPETAAEAAAVLFELNCPDEVTRCILYLNDEPNAESSDHDIEMPASEAPVEASAIKAEHAAESTVDNEESLAIGQKLCILDETQGHDATLAQLNKPVSAGANLLKRSEDTSISSVDSARINGSLTGTPLVKTPLHVSVRQTKNRTQEIVSNQWSVGKYESPAQNLPVGTKLRAVENPVETACQYLREAWNASSAHDHLTDFILSLDGIQDQIETKLCADKNGTIMQRVLQQRLLDLEAERLSALCELDRAKRDADAYKQELLNAMASRLSKELNSLESDKKTAEQQIAALKAEENALLMQRDALIAKVEELQKSILPEQVAKLFADAQLMLPTNGTPLRLTPVSGDLAGFDALVEIVIHACAASGIRIDRNYAVAVLVLLAMCPRIGIACKTSAAAATLLQNIANALGWQDSFAVQYAAEQSLLVGIRPVDSTPAVLATSLPQYAAVPGVTKLMLCQKVSGLICNSAYDISQWPVLLLPALPHIPALSAAGKPISAESLKRILEKPAVSQKELDSVLSPVLNASAPLSGTAQKEMYQFISVCAGLMDGGLPSAVDWAILLWVIPGLKHGADSYNAVKQQLNEYPLSFSTL